MEQQFLKAARAGDNAAWKVLYRQHYPWMYATALRICGNNATTKDAVQEAFVTAYLKLQQLKDAEAFAGWLKTILIRICQRERQRQSCKNCNEFSAFESTHFYDDEINRKMDWYSRQSKIYNSLSGLSHTLQSVLLLRYFSNWSSYEEIAAILSIPVGTVRSRLNQVKQKLADSWAQSNDYDDAAFKQASEWNGLYNEYFGNVYSSLPLREKLIEHFDKHVQVIFTSGKSAIGSKIIRQSIEDDILYGNSFAGLEVITSGSISIVECSNINPKEYPDRCPDRTAFVLQRTGKMVTHFTLHHSC